MQTFLNKLAAEILAVNGPELTDTAVIFPTRRAGLFFRQELSKMIDGPVWSPGIFSIQDYFASLSDSKVPDQLTLLFRLYAVYKKYFPSEDFDRFMPWGELLLKDFDDIDRYLLNAHRIFGMVTELHKIDEDFSLPEEDLERLRAFWKNFFDRDTSRLKKNFIETWQHLWNIYSDFKKDLEKDKLAYEGMAFRQIADKIRSGKFIFPENYSYIVFAGFYAFSPAENAIITHFIKAGHGKVYWDADSYYTDDKGQEAGKFLRKNPLIEKEIFWKEDHFKNEKKNIEFAGVPLLIGQAKYAGNILVKLLSENNFSPEKTAVVLPDEKLLFPVLYSLPSELNDINVTMGYPLGKSPLFDLFESLYSLQKNARIDKNGNVSFYFRDVKNILDHPYIRISSEEIIRKWYRANNQTFIRISSTLLVDQGSLFKLVFVPPLKTNEIFSWLRDILLHILNSMKENDLRFHKIESEFIYHFHNQLKRLEDIFNESGVNTSVEIFWKIFREVISSVKIPFNGEPLKGLQVMGFLETRVLDFENVILLSVNEDVLPSGGNSVSFIPYNIRKSFGLPTYEDQHAVSAYHFYRLLQRAKNIFLIYNTEAKALTAGEKSRFLLQVETELVKKFPENITLTKKIIGLPVGRKITGPVIVEKTEAVRSELSRFLTSDINSRNQLSASALISYIACPIRFYFRYVAGLQETEEPEEEMEAATFGKVVHKAMQNLYTGLPGLDESVIDRLLKNIDVAVDQAINEEYISPDQLEGKNILFRNVIRELVRKILLSEKTHLPLNILQLEKDVSMLFNNKRGEIVKLFGIIDRVDEKDGLIRIIDYKTGRVEKKKPAELSDYFSEPKYKEQFQALYYAYLTKNKIPGRPVKTGLLIVREMSDGIWFMNNNQAYSEDQFFEFEKLLQDLIHKIFSPDIPFVQTEDDRRCEYCPYSGLCHRN
jgi:RecB family exonuclease